jgi:hypothetical protein
MNGAIFRIFGITILIFNCFLVLAYGLTALRMDFNRLEALQANVVFFSILLLTTLIALGLIYLHRWAAVVASGVGLFWSILLASVLGNSHWVASFIGMPVVIGLLCPLYVTFRNWSSLRAIDNPRLSSFARALRSLDPLHLE